MKKRLRAFGEIKEDSFHFEDIERYFRKKDHSDAFQVLSEKTCIDLDFQELFMFVDRTNSRIGQQFLYNKFRTIPVQPNSNNENIISELIENSDFRVPIQFQLSKLNNNNAFYISSLFQEEHLKAPKWFFCGSATVFYKFTFLAVTSN